MSRGVLAILLIWALAGISCFVNDKVVSAICISTQALIIVLDWSARDIINAIKEGK